MAGDLRQANRLFNQAGLPLPKLPPQLARRLRMQGPWIFSTREPVPFPYNLNWYVREFDRGVNDYAVLSHSGHGINSYALQYYIALRGTFGLFLHLAWGGGYMDREETTKAVCECFLLADRILAHCQSEKARWNGKLKVVACDFYGSYWTIDGRDPAGASRSLVPPREVLKDVLAWLDALG